MKSSFMRVTPTQLNLCPMSKEKEPVVFEAHEKVHITDNDIKDYFDEDYHMLFIAKRYGFFFKDPEDFMDAKHEAIMTALRAKQRGKEFNGKKHLYYYMANAARSGISRAFKKKKNLSYIDIKYESDFRSYEDGSTAYENKLLSVEGEGYCDRSDYVKEISRKVLTESEIEILDLHLKGYNGSDIDRMLKKNLGSTLQASGRITKKLKKEKDGNTNNKRRISTAVLGLREKNRSSPTSKAKVSSERCIAASNFLNPKEKIRSVF